MMNRVILVGRLARDPELRYTPSNVATCSFTIAVERPFKNPTSGEKEADFIPVVVWRNQAENVNKFTKKGSLVGVEGRIQTRNYDDKDGIRKYVTEVVADNVTFLDSKGSQEGVQSNNDYNKKSQDNEDDKYSNASFSSNDLPF